MVAAVALALSAAAFADPSSPENGCHGYYTTQYKESVGDCGGQGSAIGGKGNSDGDPTNGQAHSAPRTGSDAAVVPRVGLWRRIAGAVTNEPGRGSTVPSESEG
jgi:hypothetical protein